MRRFALMPELAARLDGAGQIATAADHLGAMQSLLDMTLDYVKTRSQFGRPPGTARALAAPALPRRRSRCMAASA